MPLFNPSSVNLRSLAGASGQIGADVANTGAFTNVAVTSGAPVSGVGYAGGNTAFYSNFALCFFADGDNGGIKMGNAGYPLSWNGDTFFRRIGAAGTFLFSSDSSTQDGVLKVGKVLAANVIRLASFTVATLPAGVQGDTCMVSDAESNAFMFHPSGGGGNIVPVFFNNTNWLIG